MRPVRSEGEVLAPRGADTSHPSPGARTTRPGALALALACAVLLAALVAPRASAQATSAAPARSVLLLLDASKSMNDDAGNGTTRLEAAKAAVDDLVDALPADAQVGLRVYGARVAQASRRLGCRDTQLSVPVGPLDRAALKARVQALQGRGRTPIGRSLRAAAGDLPAGGKRTVILVSDGGDNCAPPDPCKAAAAVARGGVKLSISVVGLQVNERVRRELRCIADAGGGTYVDARDPDALRDELLAAIARAFRDYEPVGTPVQGGRARAQAAPVGRGQYLDSVRPGDERWYATTLRSGQQLFAAATAIPPRSMSGVGHVRLELVDPLGDPVTDTETEVWPPTDVVPQAGPQTLSLRTRRVGTDGARPGTYWLHLSLELGTLAPTTIPVELAIQPLVPGQRPAFVRPPGPLSAALGARAAPAPPGGGTRGGKARAPAASGRDHSPSAPALAGVGVGGLLVGLFAGRAALRRRRR